MSAIDATAFAVHDDVFLDVLGPAPRLERVGATAEDALYFTAVPRPGRAGPLVAIRRLALDTGALTTVRADANAANGMSLWPDGRLVVCEQGARATAAAITLVDPA